MTIYLFKDTETTGFKKGGALIQKGQARVCQIALILANDQGRILGEFSTMIKPDGWEIGEGAYKVHGITEGDCHIHGMTQEQMIWVYKHYFALADECVAHNEQFDRGMMEVELAYYGSDNPPMREWQCTMKPNSGLQGGKSLRNCYKHYTGKDLSGAHDAMIDTRACMEVFFAMKGVNVCQNV